MKGFLEAVWDGKLFDIYLGVIDTRINSLIKAMIDALDLFLQ